VRVAIPILGNRISPLLDVAMQLLVVDVDGFSEVGRREVRVDEPDRPSRARRIEGLGADVVICGAVSRTLEAMLSSAGIRMIPNTCGSVDEVLAAFISRNFSRQSFLMPGCRGARRRFRGRHRGGRRGRGRGNAGRNRNWE
jgi:predicted Fe-Mo cluster-binding NifX family protein